MAGQHDLFGDFIELGRAHRGQRVVLAINGAGFQAQVHLAKRQRRGSGTQRFTQEQPLFGAGHTQFHALEVGWCFDGPDIAQIHLAGAQVNGGQWGDIHFFRHGLEQLGTNRAVEDFLLLIGVTHDVAGGEHRKLRHQFGNVKGGNARQLQVATRHGCGLSALLEQ